MAVSIDSYITLTDAIVVAVAQLVDDSQTERRERPGRATPGGRGFESRRARQFAEDCFRRPFSGRSRAGALPGPVVGGSTAFERTPFPAALVRIYFAAPLQGRDLAGGAKLRRSVWRRGLGRLARACEFQYH